MAKNDRLGASILAAKIIPNVSADLIKSYKLKPGQKSLGLVTADCDDVTYTALDEATKKADVEVVYARSFYGGAANANTKLAGEILGVIAGPNPAEVRSGLNVILQFVSEEASFYSANAENTIPCPCCPDFALLNFSGKFSAFLLILQHSMESILHQHCS